MISDLIVKTEMLEDICKYLNKRQIKEVSFEFLIGSCFPTALQNIKEEIRFQYSQGYFDGQKENETPE